MTVLENVRTRVRGFFQAVEPSLGRVTSILRRPLPPPPPPIPDWLQAQFSPGTPVDMETLEREITKGPAPYHRAGHQDPGGVFTPQPVAKPRNPRLAAPLVQTVFVVPAGSIGEYRWRASAGGRWSEWSTRAGPCTIRQPLCCDLAEFRSRPAWVPWNADLGAVILTMPRQAPVERDQIALSWCGFT